MMENPEIPWIHNSIRPFISWFCSAAVHLKMVSFLIKAYTIKDSSSCDNPKEKG